MNTYGHSNNIKVVQFLEADQNLSKEIWPSYQDGYSEGEEQNPMPRNTTQIQKRHRSLEMEGRTKKQLNKDVDHPSQAKWFFPSRYLDGNELFWLHHSFVNNCSSNSWSISPSRQTGTLEEVAIFSLAAQWLLRPLKNRDKLKFPRMEGGVQGEVSIVFRSPH